MMNEQKQQRGKHMADKQEEQTTGAPNLDAEREELLQATQQFIRSLFRTGVQLALVPVNMLPPEPRQHFLARSANDAGASTDFVSQAERKAPIS